MIINETMVSIWKQMRTSLNTHMPNYSEVDIVLLCVKGCKETRQKEDVFPVSERLRKSLSTIFATSQNGKLFPLPKKTWKLFKSWCSISWKSGEMLSVSHQKAMRGCYGVCQVTCKGSGGKKSTQCVTNSWNIIKATTSKSTQCLSTLKCDMV